MKPLKYLDRETPVVLYKSLTADRIRHIRSGPAQHRSRRRGFSCLFFIKRSPSTFILTNGDYMVESGLVITNPD